MKKYYLQNQFEQTEEILEKDDFTAFRYAQGRNKKEERAFGTCSNWKAYNEQGDLIYFVRTV